MKASLWGFAILGAWGVIDAAHAAPGFVTLPIVGFPTSAYTNCYNDGRTAADPKGNFGSYPLITAPSASVNNTCWVPKPAAELLAPIAGYTLVGSRTLSIPHATGDSSVTIGTLAEIAWRNSATGMCLIGTRATMINVDHDSSTAGTQYFEINDIARGGFAGLTVNAGYTLFASTSYPVYRQGRTYTSVQHRALTYSTLANRAANGTNYLDLPTNLSIAASITGENLPIASTITASTTLATQDAVVNDNWVDFTLQVKYNPAGGSVSAFTYIEASCSANPTVQTGAIRLRQTAQEDATFKEIIMDGYAIGTP